jgi:hypothetical protein
LFALPVNRHQFFHPKGFDKMTKKMLLEAINDLILNDELVIFNPQNGYFYDAKDVVGLSNNGSAIQISLSETRYKSQADMA